MTHRRARSPRAVRAVARSTAVLTVGPLAALLCACGPPVLCEGEASITPTAPGINGFMSSAHAHNDYEHPRPLQDALAAGFGSVEVDIWFRDREIHVSHDPFSTKGTLEALYLDELDALLAEGTSVHGDGAPFTLWLDLKDGGAELRAALVATLARRPWLTTFDEDGVIEERAVTVVLTGDDASKRALVEETPAPRPFARDSNDIAIDSEADPNVVASAHNFGKYVGSWDGKGAPPPGLSRQCACVVERNHALGRKVRLFGGPDTPASWTFQLDHGVDFVNTDDLEGLAGVLRER
jgi:hypothetical protein